MVAVSLPWAGFCIAGEVAPVLSAVMLGEGVLFSDGAFTSSCCSVPADVVSFPFPWLLLQARQKTASDNTTVFSKDFMVFCIGINNLKLPLIPSRRLIFFSVNLIRTLYRV